MSTESVTWIVLREPGKVPERKGPFQRERVKPFVREVMEHRPTAHITVCTGAGLDFDVQDGPEWLTMADLRHRSTALKHIASTRKAHAAAPPPAINPEVREAGARIIDSEAWRWLGQDDEDAVFALRRRASLVKADAIIAAIVAGKGE